jgi:hypothetical protein
MNNFKKELYKQGLSSGLAFSASLVELNTTTLRITIVGGDAPYNFIISDGVPNNTCVSIAISSTPNTTTPLIVDVPYIRNNFDTTGSVNNVFATVDDNYGLTTITNSIIIEFCLIFGTKINTKNGIKNIEYVKEGDFILDKDGIYTKVTSATSHISDSIININNGLLQSTKSHIHIINKDGVIDEKQGEFLNIGDNLIDQYGNNIAITSLNTIEEPANVVNLSTESHTYIANGILTHNKTACP